MELSKDLVGTTIYGYPTGNNAHRSSGDSQELVEFEVVSVGRKYFELKRGKPYTSATKYCPHSGATQSQINWGYGGNAGYIFFHSVKEFEDWSAKRKLAVEISSLMRDFGYSSKALTKLTEEELHTLTALLKKALNA